MSSFPPKFIKLSLACEELESNAKYSIFGGILSTGSYMYVKNPHVCYIKFASVRISHMRLRYWYEICDVLVPSFHAICTNSSLCNLQSMKFTVQQTCLGHILSNVQV